MTRANDIATLIIDGTTIDSSGIGAGAITNTKIGAGAITNTKYGGGLSVDGSNNLTVSGYAKVGLVELDDSAVLTYNLTQGNIARYNRDSINVPDINTITLDGTSGGTLDGMGFSIMAYNGDSDSDRSITFAGGSGISVYYGDSATIKFAGPKQHTIISGLVFDSASIVLNNIAMVGSV